jgi:hypothetical protein
MAGKHADKKKEKQTRLSMDVSGKLCMCAVGHIERVAGRQAGKTLFSVFVSRQKSSKMKCVHKHFRPHCSEMPYIDIYVVQSFILSF